MCNGVFVMNVAEYKDIIGRCTKFKKVSVVRYTKCYTCNDWAYAIKI